jgi:hypothetical protein
MWGRTTPESDAKGSKQRQGRADGKRQRAWKLPLSTGLAGVVASPIELRLALVSNAVAVIPPEDPCFIMTSRRTQASGRERGARREADSIRSSSCHTAVPIVVIADTIAHVSPCRVSLHVSHEHGVWLRKNGPLDVPLAASDAQKPRQETNTMRSWGGRGSCPARGARSWATDFA